MLIIWFPWQIAELNPENFTREMIVMFAGFNCALLVTSDQLEVPSKIMALLVRFLKPLVAVKLFAVPLLPLLLTSGSELIELPLDEKFQRAMQFGIPVG